MLTIRFVENLLGYLVILFVIVLGIYNVIKTLSTKDSWKVEKSDSKEETIFKLEQRGVVSSFIVAIIFTFVNYYFLKLNETKYYIYQFYIGTILSNLYVFLLDNSIATEEAVNILNSTTSEEEGKTFLKNIPKAIRYGFSCIFTPKLLRFLITLLLDFFINIILVDYLINFSRKFYWFRDNILLRDTIILAIIDFITFICYANYTRLLWAYPPEKSTTNVDTIPTIVIVFVSIISSIIFYQWKPKSNIPELKGYITQKNKLYFITFLLLLITIGYYFKWITPRKESELIYDISDEYPNGFNFSIVKNKVYEGVYSIGLIIYILISIITLFIVWRYRIETNQDNIHNILGFIFICLLIFLPVIISFID